MNWLSTEKEIASKSKVQHRKIEFHVSTKPSTSFSVTNLESEGKSKSANKQSAKLVQIKASEIAPKVESTLCDESIVIANSSWSNVGKVGVGLYNQGNTCFLNSLLQCLLHIPAMSQTLRDHHELVFKGLDTSDSGKSISMQFQRFVKEFWESSGKAIVPKAMIQNIRRVSRQFRPGRQEDSHEYFINLLDCMHEEILKANNLKISDGKIVETSFISRVFGGHLCSELICPKCDFKSQNFNTFLDLSLNLGSGISSVDASLKEFCKTEKLSADNEWNCEGCKKKVRATKQLKIFDSPNVLALHLKRFSFGISTGKINKHIEYSPTMEISSSSDEKPAKYELCGIVVHHGYSVHSGHYVAFVKAPNELWYEMNDSSVRTVPLKQVLAQNAYILFYRKIISENVIFEAKNKYKQHENIESQQTEQTSQMTQVPPKTVAVSRFDQNVDEDDDIGSAIDNKEMQYLQMKTKSKINKEESRHEINEGDLHDIMFTSNLRLKPVYNNRHLLNRMRFVNSLKIAKKLRNLNNSEDTNDNEEGSSDSSDSSDEGVKMSQSEPSNERRQRNKKNIETTKFETQSSDSSSESDDNDQTNDDSNDHVRHQASRSLPPSKPVSLTEIPKLLQSQSIRGKHIGSEGLWDNVDSKTKDSIFSITNKLDEQEQDVLAKRQASEWDMLIDRGHQKKIKEKKRLVESIHNPFQNVLNKRMKNPRYHNYNTADDRLDDQEE